MPLLLSFPCKLHAHTFCMPSNMQAIGWTHALRFVGAAYELVGKVVLPCNSTFDNVFGQRSLLTDPVAQGVRSLGLKTTHVISQTGKGMSLLCPTLPARNIVS